MESYAFPLSAVGSSAGCFNFLAASFLYSVRDVMRRERERERARAGTSVRSARAVELNPNFGVWSQSATIDGLRSKGDEQRLTSEGRRVKIDG